MQRRSQNGLIWLVAAALCGSAAQAQIFSSPQSLKPSAAVPANGAASAFPATAPTGAGSAASAPVTPAQRSAKRAEVSFAQGQLSVKADNSSLNLILREIGRQTGIKITGGVTEERVFGSYGPGTPDAVLARLLDGTGSNVLLIASAGETSGELVLTPRLGGPTPPNPNAKGFDDDSGDDDAPRTPAPRGVTLFGGAQPTEVAPQTPPQNANGFPPITAPTPASGATATPGTPQSPNGVKTPQEIYQQLQQLRQQQQQQQQAEPPDGSA